MKTQSDLPRVRRPLRSRVALFAVALLWISAPAAAQQADKDDVESVDAIIEALYDVISGDEGDSRDWDRFHSLFLPGADLVPTLVTPDSSIRHVVWTPEQYVEHNSEALEQIGFHETEVSRTTEEFGNLAHVFSTYESRSGRDGEVFQRGINSIQLLWNGERWFVVNIAWDQEREGNKIPERYLNGN
jgi:hypothetical protein